MTEELYIIKGVNKYRLDLNSPSGITLKFQSNLFGDFSKIVASYSYTFKLPMTTNNRRLLDNADDIRHNSSYGRTKLEAEFYQDGLSLFKGANLYIDSIAGEYSCVMTWGVVTGLDNLKDNDISINELPSGINDIVKYGEYKQAEIANLDNTAAVIHPIYDSGVPAYYYDEPSGGSVRPRYHEWIAYKTDDDMDRWQYAYPMPVVPLKNILNRINSHFGVNIKFGETFAFSNLSDYTPTQEKYDIINRGVLPLVSRELTSSQLQARRIMLTPSDYYKGDVYTFTSNRVQKIEVSSWLLFSDYANDYTDDPFNSIHLCTSNSSTSKLMGFGTNIWGTGAKIDGFIEMKFEDLVFNNGMPEESPVLKAFQVIVAMNEHTYINRHNTHFELKEVGSVEGEVVSGSATAYSDHPTYLFDFRSSYGMQQFNISDLQDCNGSSRGCVVFAFDHEIRQLVDKSAWTIVPDIDDSNNHSRNIDIIHNLPDISCQTLIKALYYMIGAFPAVDDAGAIVPLFYNTLKENIESGNVVDWSGKLYASGYRADDIKFTVGNFAQINYYLMKTDDIDDNREDGEPETDIYASGVGIINVASTVIERKKTIFTSPFNAPYIRNDKQVQYPTGNTMKCWVFENGELKFVSPKPVLGLIYQRPYDWGEGYTGVYYSMEVWNGFTNMAANPSYKYLQEIVRTPVVIKETIRLNQFDLAELDYTKPVYLDKYNAFFAIVSVQRDSKGKCKVELIKLP